MVMMAFYYEELENSLGCITMCVGFDFTVSLALLIAQKWLNNQTSDRQKLIIY